MKKRRNLYKIEYSEIDLILLASVFPYLKLGMLFPFIRFVGCFI